MEFLGKICYHVKGNTISIKKGLATPEQVAEALNLPLGKVKELAKEI